MNIERNETLRGWLMDIEARELWAESLRDGSANLTCYLANGRMLFVQEWPTGWDVFTPLDVRDAGQCLVDAETRLGIAPKGSRKP